MSSFLIVSLVLFVLWLTIMLFSSETRREQVIMSIVGLVLSPGILIIVASDFRSVIADGSSTIGIEDLLFAFSLFGIAAVIYQVLVGHHAHKLRGADFESKHIGHWIGHLILILGLWAFASLLMIHVFALSTIHSLIVGGLLIGMYVIAERHDLLMNALLSGLFVAALVFITEQIFFVRLFPLDASTFWQWNALSKFVIGGIPLEEIMWAAVVGFTIGPMYEWLRKYEVR
ncbi:MAG: lycopene cyclase domain-containing protein [Patescibacteria group bacterium]